MSESSGLQSSRIEAQFDRLNSTEAVHWQAVLSAADVDENSGAAAGYRSLAGHSDPLPVVLGSDQRSAMRMARNLSTTLSVSLVRPWDFGFIEIDNIELDGATDRLAIKSARKALNIVKGLAPNVFGKLIPHHVPDTDDAGGCAIGIAMRLIVWGAAIRDESDAAMSRAQHKLRGRQGELPIVATWVNPNSVNLSIAARRIFCTGDPYARRARRMAADQGMSGWEATAGDRAWRRFQLLSLAPMRKLLFGFGEGHPLANGVLGDAEHHVKAENRKGRDILHRDAVPNFWWGEAVRLGRTDLRLPFVEVR
jgi:hypothetical protein